MKKYLILPGVVRAKDGDLHHISADQLISLYGVDRDECKIISQPQDALGLDWSAYIQLRPRSDGKYNL